MENGRLCLDQAVVQTCSVVQALHVDAVECLALTGPESMVLVPATMKLMGDANRWLPGWLDRILPKIDIDGEVDFAEADKGWFRSPETPLASYRPTPSKFGRCCERSRWWS